MPNAPQLAVPFAFLAAAAGYAALESSRHAALTGTARARVWLLVSVLMMAVSSWCTHFIGVSVLSGRNTLGAVITVAGLCALVVVSATTLAGRRQGRAAPPLIAGALFGSALSGMHGTGVGGVMLAARMERSDEVVTLTITIAAVMTVLAVALALRVRAGGRAQDEAVAATTVAKRALRESEARFREIAEHIEEVFYVLEADGAGLLYVSPAFERMWGRPPGDAWLSPDARMESIHPDDRGRVQAALALVAGGESTDETYRIVRPDGTRRWVRDRAYPVPARHGEPQRVVGIVDDVTAEHEAEERLARLNAQLEERVIARTDELAAANRALEEQSRRAREASRLKSEFLANMSHELRTPLNAIIGFAELLHDGKVGPVSELQQEYLGDVLTSARHLLQLINDVLDLSKIEAGKMEFRPEPVDVGRIVAEVRDILRTVAAQKRIRVTVDVQPLPGAVVVDPSRLKQVLYNYLSNALKFTPDEGKVGISVSRAGRDAFRLEVRDTGIGIAAADLGKLFGEFQQLDAGDSKRYGGTGLGLALTKRIVEAQGGAVGVASTPGVGSTFYAILPREAAAQGAQQAIRPTESAPFTAPMLPRDGARPDRRVLVVEDEPGDREWLERTLGTAGYATLVVPTAQAAIAACAVERFDAVVLDLLLPDMTGWDVLRAIRADERNCDVPVVVSTVVKERASSIGFAIHDYLVKPVQAPDLLASLERAGVQPDHVDPVLVVDDDQMALKLMYTMLTQFGFQPVCVDSGERGLEVAGEIQPSAVVLDLLMPGMDGFEFLERFRGTEAGRLTPVIVWTNKDLTQADLARLRDSATALATKSQGADGHVLDELKRHLLNRPHTPATGTARVTSAPDPISNRA